MESWRQSLSTDLERIVNGELGAENIQKRCDTL